MLKIPCVTLHHVCFDADSSSTTKVFSLSGHFTGPASTNSNITGALKSRGILIAERFAVDINDASLDLDADSRWGDNTASMTAVSGHKHYRVG